MIFRQVFDSDTCTYSYLLGCGESRVAVLVDPVLDQVDRDLALLQQLELDLAYTLETHIHADHVTGAARLRSLTNCLVAYPASDMPAEADLAVSELDPLAFGRRSLKPLFTPGHTDGHHAYFSEAGGTARVMTGDALLIDGCGRTDFQGGCAQTLFRSVHEKIFTLAPDTLVFPGHDYNNRHVSTVGQERERNPRLGGARTADEFASIMASLDLPRPKKIDVAVPANRHCGAVDCEESLAIDQVKTPNRN